MTGVFALSVAETVEKYGAYLAVASFIGLAALSILYFSQARELKRLRDWAGRAPERAAESQDRVVQQASEAARRVQAQPIPKPAPAKPPVAASAAGATAATAAGAAGVAAAAGAGPPKPGAPATAVSPTAAPESGNGVATTDDDAKTEDGEVATDGDAKAADATPEAPAADEKPKETAAVAPSAPGAPVAPSTVAARDAAAPPAPAVPVDLGETTEFDVEGTDPVEAPPPLPPRRAPVRPAAAAAPLRATTPSASPRRPGAPPAEPGRSRGTWPIVAGVVVALGAGVFGATQLLGDDEAPAPNQAAPPDPVAETTPAPSGNGSSSGGASERGDITVAVLNGTTTQGLAAKVADKVEEAGFVRGTTGNNADQQRAASQVFFAQGKRAAAREVAKLLGIGDVLELDANTRGLAGENAAVVVVVGSDQQP